ncbi:dockerin type I repeat-containing protein [Ruminococcus sp.]|uniref:dockerin type I repeat-containing protein n=1 Tax=Ruminococcus sp. TaxID=41978 RepID=UPI002636F14C|nr:dockerin type I repeat-containing protein [Ruminococcus sp.]MDD6989078.1 dockerin type I repeat-containing protein [Ruminococcus sp.]MDY6200947.1 dockerin type I repeat-containing protein [Ruminococcus sp.]
MKKVFNIIFTCFIVITLISVSIVSSFAIDLSTSTPDCNNTHLKRKLITKDSNLDSHQWITNYDEETQDSFNCYAYSIGVNYGSFNPGDSTVVGTLANRLKNKYVDVYELSELIITDLNNFGMSGRILENSETAPTIKLKSNEFLIAVRVTPKSIFEKGNYDTYDFHFMRRIGSTWRYKSGKDGKVVQLQEGYTPNDITWDTITLNTNNKDEYDYIQKKVNYYTSNIIYMAVTTDSFEPNININAFPTIYPTDVNLENNLISLGIGACYYINPLFEPSNTSNQNIQWSNVTHNKGVAEIINNNKLVTKKAGSCSFLGSCVANRNLLVSFDVNVLDILIGDANLDKNITIDDCTVAQKYIAGATNLNEDALFASDTNGDGKVDIIDVTNIQKKISGAIDYFEIIS